MFPMFQVPNEAEGIIRTHVKSYAIVHDPIASLFLRISS